MSVLYCYSVDLPTTNAMKDSIEHRGGYITVDNGRLFVVASNAAEVAEEFPQAIEIRRIGIGYRKA